MATLVPLPITVIGGYLGAGKTTLVNHLLREARGRRIAVLVNDFGELPIDADLIQNAAGKVITIAGGCICCSYGSDLIVALEDLAALTPRPDQVLVETSGVALPGAVASAIALVTGYVLDGVLVLADAETIRRRAADPYMADTVLRQVRDADLILLNKIDLVEPAELAATRRWLTVIAPGRPVVEIREGRIPPALAFGAEHPWGAPPPHESSDTPHFSHEHARHDHDTTMFASASLWITHAVDTPRLARLLTEAQPELLRAKGIVRDPTGATVQLQVVGTRWRVEPAVTALTGPGRLVAIARTGDVVTATLAALVEACRAGNTAA